MRETTLFAHETLFWFELKEQYLEKLYHPKEDNVELAKVEIDKLFDDNEFFVSPCSLNEINCGLNPGTIYTIAFIKLPWTYNDN